MSKLIEEPTSLPAHHIYQGGSAPGVECANCSAGATSGSWRRGWELEDNNHANLCNRCGQRWVKLGKALAKNGYAQAAAIVDPKPRPPPRQPLSAGPAITGAILHAGTKRPFSLLNNSALTSYNPSRLAQRRSSTATMRSRLRSETTSETSEGAGLSSNDDSPPQLDSYGPEITPVVGSVVNPSHVYPSQNYAPKYSMQRLAEGRSSYTLFWVLGSRAAGGSGAPILAVVGIDSHSSGHFNYMSVPGTCPPSAAPLHCTSRADAILWLVAAMGINPREKPVPESSARLPQVTVADLMRLLGEEATPVGGVGGGGSRYTSTLPAGQLPLAENYFGSPSTVARQSPSKLDRGAKVKPGGGISSILTGGSRAFHLGAVATNNNKANVTTAKNRTMMHNSSSLSHFRCSACGRDDHATDDCLLNCTSPPTLIHNPGTDIHASLDGLFLPGTDRNHLQGNVNDALGLDLLFGHHGEEDSPMQDTAFDSFLDINFGPAGAHLSPSGEPSPGAVTQPARAPTPTNITAYPQTFDTTAVGGGPRSSLMPPPPPHQPTHFDPQYRQQNQQNQQASGLEDTIRVWAATLSGNISEFIPSTNAGAGRWVPLGEALAILHNLSMLDLSLEILEKTRISRAVGMLRNHSNASIATAAHALASRWHQYAIAALHHANNNNIAAAASIVARRV